MVTVNTSQLYAYNGDLVSLLGLSVAPSFTQLNAVIEDADGVLSSTGVSTFSIGGGAPQDLVFNSAGTVSDTLGLGGTRDIAVFTSPSSPGITYVYAPDGLPSVLGIPLIYTYNLNQTSFALPTTTPGIVDGTEAGEVMSVGYIDPDGDRITNSGFLVTGNDVSRGKPDPQVFQIAADRLGISTRRCVVIEDAPAGIAAAHAAEMPCIALVSTGRTQDELREADRVVTSLSQITPTVIRDLIGRNPRC